MEQWYLMFAGVQKIVQTAANPEEGLQQLLAFVAQHPDDYDDAEYWQWVASTPMPFDTLKSWAKDGFETLVDSSGWSLITLDCGDTPDIFRLSELSLVDEADFNTLAQLVQTAVLRHFEEFPRVERFYNAANDITLVWHNICDELNHPILSWYANGEDEGWHGDNGYLLWLTVATLALCDVLRNVDYWRSILKGREKILVISGYEEIFFYVGTISEEGFQP